MIVTRPGRVFISRDCSAIAGCCKRRVRCARMFRRSSDAVATSREGDRQPRSSLEGQHRPVGDSVLDIDQVGRHLTWLKCKSVGGELLSRPRYPGQTHSRAVHGDEIGHHGERPDQANRDHDGDSHYPCAHLHPLYVALSLPIGARIFFCRPNVRWFTNAQNVLEQGPRKIGGDDYSRTLFLGQ